MHSDETSTSSSPSVSTPPSNVCLVCDQIAYGNHFGAFVCRACAAFFRRAILNKYSNLKCHNIDEKCEEFIVGRRLYCKKCRLQKCLSVGMSASTFQFDHDLISTTNKFNKKKKEVTTKEKIPDSMETFLGRPHFLITLEPELASHKKSLVDVNFLMDKAADIFEKGIFMSLNLNNMNCLDKLTFGLNAVRNRKNDQLQNLTKMGMKEAFLLWEEDLLTTAKWLSYCDEFQKLPKKSKMQILKFTWQIWIRLQKLMLTADMRIKKMCQDDMAMVSMEAKFDTQQIEIDVAWFTNYTVEQLSFFLEPWENDLIDNIMTPLMKLRPTPTEQAFMLAQISFQFAGIFFQGNILQATEKIHETTSNDLHNYYVNEIKEPHYSGRLAKLMKINNSVKKEAIKLMERKEIAKLFEVFKVEFTHPDMFYWRK